MIVLLLWPKHADLKIRMTGAGCDWSKKLLQDQIATCQSNASGANRTTLFSYIKAFPNFPLAYPTVISAILVLQNYKLFVKWTSGTHFLALGGNLKVEFWIRILQTFGFARCESM